MKIQFEPKEDKKYYKENELVYGNVFRDESGKVFVFSEFAFINNTHKVFKGVMIIDGNGQNVLIGASDFVLYPPLTKVTDKITITLNDD